MHFEKSGSSREKDEKIFKKREQTVMVRGWSLLPPDGHIRELHQRLDLIFKSDQGYLFSAFQWVKHCRAGVLNCGRFAAPSPLGAFGGVWRYFWLSLLGTGATGLQWVEVRAIDQLPKGMMTPPKERSSSTCESSQCQKPSYGNEKE